MATGPNGTDIPTEAYDPNNGIPDSIDNRAAIIADRLGWYGPLHTIEHVKVVLVAAEELDLEVAVRAADTELDS